MSILLTLIVILMGGTPLTSNDETFEDGSAVASVAFSQPTGVCKPTRDVEDACALVAQQDAETGVWSISIEQP